MFMTKEARDKMIYFKFRNDIIEISNTLSQIPISDEQTFDDVFYDLVANCYVFGKLLDEWLPMN